MTEAEALAALRARIDALDVRLLELLNERASIALEVARVKSENGSRGPYYRPEREAQVLRAARARNQGPLSGETVARLFREVMSACLALEAPPRVAYLGPEGTWTGAAALRQFGMGAQCVPVTSVEEVFRAVEGDDCGYGVVPVENSLEGVINITLDRFLESPLKICGEVELAIHHCLLARDTELARVSRVCAHQQALAQCRAWLDRSLPGIPREAVSSNADGARRAAGEPGVAAIAAEATAALYGLAVAGRNIEDDPSNTTRFLVLARAAPPPSGNDKTSLVFSTANRPGALHHALGAFAEHGIGMTRIESRPSRRGTWEYVFFADIEGHAEDQHVAAALAHLQDRASMVKLLGSYPRAAL